MAESCADGETSHPLSNQMEEATVRFHCRSKRQMKKKISLVYLLKVICSSQETCLDWLKNRGLIPKIMFCPNCCRKMKFEVCEQAIDGYKWICKDCRMEPPEFSSRHGSWLENKEAPLVDVLLFTYLWTHGFSEAQIVKETNMTAEETSRWCRTYSEICEALARKNENPQEGDAGDESILDINAKDLPVAIWRKKNKYKDPFVEFLKDADSL